MLKNSSLQHQQLQPQQIDPFMQHFLPFYGANHQFMPYTPPPPPAYSQIPAMVPYGTDPSTAALLEHLHQQYQQDQQKQQQLQQQSDTASVITSTTTTADSSPKLQREKSFLMEKKAWQPSSPSFWSPRLTKQQRKQQQQREQEQQRAGVAPAAEPTAMPGTFPSESQLQQPAPLSQLPAGGYLYYFPPPPSSSAAPVTERQTHSPKRRRAGQATVYNPRQRVPKDRCSIM